MITNASYLMHALSQMFDSIGIVPFYQVTYEKGYPRPKMSPCQVAVVAGYLPGRAALFSCNVRFHPEGQNDENYFVMNVLSQHMTTKEIPPIFSRRIYRPTDEKSKYSLGYHHLPILQLDGYFGELCHHMGQSLEDADYPISEMVKYAGDIFFQFITQHNGNLLNRFTQHVTLDVVPYGSLKCHEVSESLNAHGKDLEEYFWQTALGQISDRTMANPSFPLPPVGVGR